MILECHFVCTLRSYDGFNMQKKSSQNAFTLEKKILWLSRYKVGNPLSFMAITEHM